MCVRARVSHNACVRRELETEPIVSVDHEVIWVNHEIIVVVVVLVNAPLVFIRVVVVRVVVVRPSVDNVELVPVAVVVPVRDGHVCVRGPGASDPSGAVAVGVDDARDGRVAHDERGEHRGRELGHAPNVKVLDRGLVFEHGQRARVERGDHERAQVGARRQALTFGWRSLVGRGVGRVEIGTRVEVEDLERLVEAVDELEQGVWRDVVARVERERAQRERHGPVSRDGEVDKGAVVELERL